MMDFRPNLTCRNVPLGPCSDLKIYESVADILNLGGFTLISRSLTLLDKVEDLVTVVPGDWS